MIYFAGILFLIVNILCFVSRVPYSCRPYTPQDDCEVGRYEIRLYEYHTDRYPIAIAESHCVVSMLGRLKAEQVRFTVYSKYTREISEVEFYDDLELPIHNLEVCSWQ